MKLTSLLSVATLVFAASSATQAATIVDTGTPDGTSQAAVFGFTGGIGQYYAGLVDLSQAYTITKIETHGTGNGLVRFAFYDYVANGSGIFGDHPEGSPVAATGYFSINIASNAADWYGASSLSIALAAGKYWVAIEPADIVAGGIDGTLTSGAMANQLAAYSFSQELPSWPTWRNITFAPPQPVALRIEGTAASAPAVPEPASWALMIGGFALAGAVMRRQRAAVVFG